VNLVLVGSSHKVAPVEVRELVAVPLERAGELARELAGDDAEAVCLSTCNRTELYLSSVDEERAVTALEDLAGESLDGVLYRLQEDAAAVHLFRVAAGLDSLVPGEGEILGQVRDAYEAVTPGPTLDRVFRQALAVGKRVRTETAIGESPASVSSAAAALAAQVFGDLNGRRVLLVGAGRIGELAASNLASRGAEIAFVANRTVETARELAHRFGGAALALDRATSIPRSRISPAVSSTTSTTWRRLSPRRLTDAGPRRSVRSNSSARRRNGSAPGARRSTSCRRSHRSAPTPRRSGARSSRRCG
jgi:glutamyl-tRNA reductase